ncbi:MAG: hypothetical protein Q8934_20440 [Bacillota bacterium]|nr:hypothetical protein [Bacillota bacterium]
MDPKQAICWSIAFPGFGQLLNKRYVKGLVLLTLEILVNIQANFNKAIILSFQGDIKEAIAITNYQWLMFYPCLYFFSMWDAYKEAGGGKNRYSFLPFVFSAYFVTIGLMYSTTGRIFGKVLGPVWFPMIFVIPGLIVGFILMKIWSK